MHCFLKVLTTFYFISSSYQKNYFTRNQKKINILLRPHFHIFFVIVTATITKRFNNQFSRIMWSAAMWFFFHGCVAKFIVASLLYYCSLDKSFPTATLFHNFQNIFHKFDTEVATEIDFNMFQFGKHLFQFSARN